MHVDRESNGEGGYVWKESDRAYEMEVEAEEEEKKKKASRPVATITPQIGVVPTSNPTSSSSESDEPPPLIDVIPPTLQRHIEFMEQRRRLLLIRNERDNSEAPEGDVESDQDVFA